MTDAIFDAAARAVSFTPRQELPVTDPAQTASIPPAPRQPSTWAQAVHSAVLHARQMVAELDSLRTHLAASVDVKFAGIENACRHALPLVERIVSDPVLDEFVEAALTAANAGVEAEVFAAFATTLRSAAAGKTGPQQVLPAPPADPAVTGQQPAVPDAAEQDADGAK